ncbi:hypothetical protein [Ruegeria atlantica]|uniref:Lipoprotein n=1 Tax=Ruegeria atlantica TaxID=81569 RepID=A0A0P1E3V9_9RHOB|nr:hypothetical protein [Ruegeria atlantica]CUH41545.1 hypothetical protein RUM4293_00419 [Ruegeria atlantica]
MLRTMALLALFVIAACDSRTERLSREYQIGEELMIDCQENGQRCPEYRNFKKRFEANVDNVTTFERSLATHKARIARGALV